MSKETENEEKAQLRKKRRKKEQARAIALVGGVLLVAVLVLALAVSGVVRLIGGSSKSKKASDAAVTAQADTKSGDDKAAKEEKKDKDPDEGKADAGKDETEADEPQQADGAQVEPEQGSDEDDTDTDAADDATSDGGEAADEPVTDGSAANADASDGDADGETTADDGLDPEIEQRITEDISQMTVEAKVCKLFILTPGELIGTELEPKQIDGRFGDQLSKYPVSGIILRDDNLVSEDELRTAMSNIRMYGMNSQLLVIEDEGGEGSPLVKNGISENVISSEREIGESQGTAGAYSAGISLGSEMKHYNFDLTLAPYADEGSKPGSYAAAYGFGKGIEETTELTKSVVRGLEDQGVLCAVKYFPGYTDVNADGSRGAVVSQKSKDDLAKEAPVFQEAIKAGADVVMISHVGLPKVRGDQRPASLSKEIITDIVRDEWGYDGVIMTDFMDKSCIYQKYTYAESAAGAIEAGADILLCTKNFQKSYHGVLDAVRKGTISEERLDESVRRILRLKYKML